MTIKKDLIQTAIAICVLFGMAFGAVSYFAKAEDLRLVEVTQKVFILETRIQKVQERIWMFEDRYGKGCGDCDSVSLAEYRKLLQELEGLKRRLEGVK